MALPPFLVDSALDRFRTKACDRLIHDNYCGFRDQCQFSHKLDWIRRQPQKYEYSAVLCPEVKFEANLDGRSKLSNKCANGKSCPYSHSREEQLFHPTMYKTVLCKQYLFSQSCSYYYCPFAHGEDELRRSSHNLYKISTNNTVLPTIQAPSSACQIDDGTAAPSPNGSTASFNKDNLDPELVNLDPAAAVNRLRKPIPPSPAKQLSKEKSGIPSKQSNTQNISTASQSVVNNAILTNPKGSSPNSNIKQSAHIPPPISSSSVSNASKHKITPKQRIKKSSPSSTPTTPPSPVPQNSLVLSPSTLALLRLHAGFPTQPPPLMNLLAIDSARPSSVIASRPPPAVKATFPPTATSKIPQQQTTPSTAVPGANSNGSSRRGSVSSAVSIPDADISNLAATHVSKAPSLSNIDPWKSISPLIYLNTARALPPPHASPAAISLSHQASHAMQNNSAPTPGLTLDAFLASGGEVRTFVGFAVEHDGNFWRNSLSSPDSSSPLDPYHSPIPLSAAPPPSSDAAALLFSSTTSNLSSDLYEPSAPSARRVRAVIRELPLAVIGAVPDAPAKGSIATGGGEPWTWEFSWLLSRVATIVDSLLATPRPKRILRPLGLHVSRRPEGLPPPLPPLGESTSSIATITGAPSLRPSAVSLWIAVEFAETSLFERSCWPPECFPALSMVAAASSSTIARDPTLDMWATLTASRADVNIDLLSHGLAPISHIDLNLLARPLMQTITRKEVDSFEGGGSSPLLRPAPRSIGSVLKQNLMNFGSANESAANSVCQPAARGHQTSYIIDELKFPPMVGVSRMVSSRRMEIPHTVINCLRSAIMGVHEMHERRMIHRRLHPGNFLFTAAHELKVADCLSKWRLELVELAFLPPALSHPFSQPSPAPVSAAYCAFARNFIRSQAANIWDLQWQSPETIRYIHVLADIAEKGISSETATRIITPEMLAGREFILRSADVWSLGCALFFFASCGAHPYGDATKPSVNVKLAINSKGPPEVSMSPFETCPLMQHLLSRLLDPNPFTRLLAGDALKHPIFWNSSDFSSFAVSTIPILLQSNPPISSEVAALVDKFKSMQLSWFARTLCVAHTGDAVASALCRIALAISPSSHCERSTFLTTLTGALRTLNWVFRHASSHGIVALPPLPPDLILSTSAPVCTFKCVVADSLAVTLIRAQPLVVLLPFDLLTHTPPPADLANSFTMSEHLERQVLHDPDPLDWLLCGIRAREQSEIPYPHGDPFGLHLSNKPRAVSHPQATSSSSILPLASTTGSNNGSVGAPNISAIPALVTAQSLSASTTTSKKGTSLNPTAPTFHPTTLSTASSTAANANPANPSRGINTSPPLPAPVINPPSAELRTSTASTSSRLPQPPPLHSTRHPPVKYLPPSHQPNTAHSMASLSSPVFFNPPPISPNLIDNSNNNNVDRYPSPEPPHIPPGFDHPTSMIYHNTTSAGGGPSSSYLYQTANNSANNNANPSAAPSSNAPSASLLPSPHHHIHHPTEIHRDILSAYPTFGRMDNTLDFTSWSSPSQPSSLRHLTHTAHNPLSHQQVQQRHVLPLSSHLHHHPSAFVQSQPPFEVFSAGLPPSISNNQHARGSQHPHAAGPGIAFNRHHGLLPSTPSNLNGQKRMQMGSGSSNGLWGDYPSSTCHQTIRPSSTGEVNMGADGLPPTYSTHSGSQDFSMIDKLLD